MPQSSRRSSSAQRGSRSGSVKRGQQRATTPSRRLSDLPERPAWDGTSSNLDKYKLTAEELDRRRASRVSKNRPLAADASRRSFVEAWAKHVTAGVLHSGEDTAPDQNRPRGTPAPADDLPINYRSVVDMLRKSPGVPKAPTSERLGAQLAGDRPGTRSPGAGVPGYQTASGAGSGSADRSPGLSYGSASVGPGTAEGAGDGNSPSAAAADGLRGGATGGGRGVDTAGTRPKELAAAGGADDGAGLGNVGGGAAAVHRGEISITPVTMRPRFTAADTTTVIAFGSDSESEGDRGFPSSSPNGYPARGNEGSPGADPITAAFEAALLGRGAPPAEAAGLPAGAGTHLAWMSGDVGTAPGIGSAADDVERRLRTLEAAVMTRGSGSGLGDSEELAGLRRELKKVQQDNAKLRQELSAFSAHASTLLTQLQAQVQQLLRGAGTPPTMGPTFSATAFPQPHVRQPHAFSAASGISAAPAPAASASAAAAPSGASALRGSTTFAAADMLRQGGLGDVSQPMEQPPTGPAARRANIFADIDLSAIRPLGAAGGSGAGSGGAGAGGVGPFAAPFPAAASALTPRGAGAGAGAGLYGAGWFASRQTDPTESEAGMGGFLRDQAAALSPPIDIPSAGPAAASGPQGARAVPVHNLDDVEAALPSFAAFRRSAGAAAFTSAARPAAAPFTNLPGATPGAAVANAGLSPPSASGGSGATAAVQPRSFPTQYQPRSLGGAIVRPANLAAAAAAPPAGHGYGHGHGSALLGAAAASATNATSGAYAAAAAASAAAAAATGSDVAAAGLARAHSGLPQPLVFSMGPEFRAARASGLSTDNSMSLSAHTAAAAAARATRAAGGGPGAGR